MRTTLFFRAQVVVSSTDFDPEQSEELQVVGVEKAVHMNDTWILSLSSPLQYMHYGEPMPAGVRGVEFPQVRLLAVYSLL